MTATTRKIPIFLKSASCLAIASMLVVMTPSPSFARGADSEAAGEATFSQSRLGPKKSVAVIDFGANGAFLSQYGGWDAGGGLAAMLETELSQTNQFRLANRSHLDAALYEQQLSQSGLTAARTALPGQLVGAQYLVRASVTDFTLHERGSSISVGGTIGGVLGGISPRSRTGRVSIDFQVLDSTSGEVVDSFSVTRKIKSKSIALSASKSGLNVGGSTFKNTPLGEAARDAIAEAAYRITQSLQNQSWSAHVAQASADTLYVNVGADAGLQPGDTLRIYRIVEQINDPITGAVLGMEKAEIGQAVISSVEAQYARASFRAMMQPEAGDILTYTNQQLAQLGGARGDQ
jgi:curli biogenesis system outer membrane secretion channel CsgG